MCHSKVLQLWWGDSKFEEGTGGGVGEGGFWVPISLKEHSCIVERIYASFKDIVIKEMKTPFFRFYSHGT